MTKEITVCFRFDRTTDQRINRILGPRYPTRSRFIRAAVEMLLLSEEGQARSRAAQRTIQRG